MIVTQEYVCVLWKLIGDESFVVNSLLRGMPIVRGCCIVRVRYGMTFFVVNTFGMD